MCEFCENKSELPTELNSLRVEIVGNKLEIGYSAYSTDSSFSTEIQMNYCMMCGRDLRNIPENKKEENDNQTKQLEKFDYAIETKDGSGIFTFLTQAKNSKEALFNLLINSNDFKIIVKNNVDLKISVKEIK